jgi:DNA-binding MarR family transcriptional regulator
VSNRDPGSAPATTGGQVTDLRSTAGLAAGLRPALLRLARRLRQMRDESVDLNSNQLSAMSVLLNHGDQLMGELAAKELIQPPSMTRIVNDLEQRGFVRRSDNPQDKRQARVSLTDAGRAVLIANRRRRNDWLARRLAELEPTEREILRKAVPILEKVNHA